MKLRILLICISLLFNGCTLLYSYSDNLPEKIEQWIKEKNYRTALDTIDYIKPGHKDYRKIQKQKKRILKKLEQHETAVIEKSRHLAETGEWLKAFALLDKASEQIGDTKKLIRHRQQLLQQRSRIIYQYENDWLQSQARFVASQLPFYYKISKTAENGESDILDMVAFQQLRLATIEQLTERSQQLFQQSRYDESLKQVELALTMEPDRETRQLLQKIKQHIRKNTRLKKLARFKQNQELLARLLQGHSYDILKQAKQEVNWLRDNAEGNTGYLQLARQLGQHLEMGLKQYFNTARKLYSKGKTQEALSIWQELVAIEPDYPKLKSHIQRAEKVLEKLKKLSNKPAATSKP